MATVTFIGPDGEEVTVRASLAEAPYDDHGKPTSLLALAMREGFFIDHACGGVCACSTCHIYVEKGMDSLSAAEDPEEDQLDQAPALTMRSRLACQAAILRDDAVIIARVPKVNRNQVSEHA